jgi:hypothetical protein
MLSAALNDPLIFEGDMTGNWGGVLIWVSVMVRLAFAELFSSTDTVLSMELATAKSALPSPLKSPTLIDLGL